MEQLSKRSYLDSNSLLSSGFLFYSKFYTTYQWNNYSWNLHLLQIIKLFFICPVYLEQQATEGIYIGFELLDRNNILFCKQQNESAITSLVPYQNIYRYNFKPSIPVVLNYHHRVHDVTERYKPFRYNVKNTWCLYLET